MIKEYKMEEEFDNIIKEFNSKIDGFKEKYNLNDGNIFLEIDHSLSKKCSPMKDGSMNPIPNIGFIPHLKFILAKNH